MVVGEDIVLTVDSESDKTDSAVRSTPDSEKRAKIDAVD
jgi:hypothetical protein